MTRPTIDHVDHTAVLLRLLARDTDPDYRLVARIIDRLAWLDGEIRQAEQARGYPHGPGDIHVTTTGAAGIEGRLHDPLLRELRRLRRDWRRQLGMLEDGYTCTACGVRFTTGWQRGMNDVTQQASSKAV